MHSSSDAAAAAAAVAQPQQLPSQDQLYAYYLQRCGHYGVAKPNAAMLRLLADVSCDTTPLAARTTFRLPTSEHGDVDDDECNDNDDSDDDDSSDRDDDDAAVRASGAARVHVGVRGMMALLDVLAVLPRVRVVDLSNTTSWYAADAFASDARWRGNDVVRRLCAVLRRMPVVRRIDVRGQPVGTAAAQALLAMVQARDGQVTRLRYTRDGVAQPLCARIDDALRHNRQRRRSHRRDRHDGSRGSSSVDDMTAATAMATSTRTTAASVVVAVSDAARRDDDDDDDDTVVTTLPATLPLHDRKTLREQHALRALLASHDDFTDCLSPSQLSALVLHARVLSTAAVVTRCTPRRSSDNDDNDDDNDSNNDDNNNNNNNSTCTRSRGGVRGDGQYLFIIYTGALRVCVDARGVLLQRGDYFGDTYDDELLFAASPLVEHARGCVYALPLSCCAALHAVWATRLRRTYAVLRRAPVLQSVDAWSRMRACTSARTMTCTAGAVVVRVDGDVCDSVCSHNNNNDDDDKKNEGDSDGALCVVLRGKFVTRPAPLVATAAAAAASTTALARACPYDKRRVVHSRRAVVSFTPGDVFGYEALVARNGRHSVSVVAAAAPAAAAATAPTTTHSAVTRDVDDDNTDDVTHMYARIRGCGMRVLVAQLRPVLCALARSYSLHAELRCAACPTATRDASPPARLSRQTQCHDARRHGDDASGAVAATSRDADGVASMYFM